MPMGLRNAPATFQALMHSLFYDCIDEFIFVYIDYSHRNSVEYHIDHLNTILSRLHHNELFAERSKCELMTQETEFL